MRAFCRLDVFLPGQSPSHDPRGRATTNTFHISRKNRGRCMNHKSTFPAAEAKGSSKRQKVKVTQSLILFAYKFREPWGRSFMRNSNVPISKQFGGSRPISPSHVTERYSFRRWPPFVRADSVAVCVSVIDPSSSDSLKSIFPHPINYVKQKRRRAAAVDSSRGKAGYVLHICT